MHAIGTFDAKTHFSSIIERVIQGESILITKHGLPVAKLMPISKNDREEVLNAVESILAFQQKHILGLDWKILRDEGRK